MIQPVKSDPIRLSNFILTIDMDNLDPKFYEVMKYPVPLHKELYRYINETEKKENNATTPDIQKTFSR